MSKDYQRLFDQAYKGVMAQGCRSRAGEFCAYRGDGGNLKCAIGHLLSDELMAKYSISEDDGPGSFSNDLIRELAPEEDNTGQTRMFLYDLRRAHDFSDGAPGVEFNNQYIASMRRAADRWNLEMA